jgi:hypothetical protein
LQCGALEAEARFWGLLVIVRMKAGQASMREHCSTHHMLYLAGTNHNNIERQRDFSTFGAAMIVEWWTRMRDEG